MGMMVMMFVQLIICLVVVLIGIMWVALQAAIIRALGLFGICLVIATHFFGPLIIIALACD